MEARAHSRVAKFMTRTPKFWSPDHRVRELDVAVRKVACTRVARRWKAAGGPRLKCHGLGFGLHVFRDTGTFLDVVFVSYRGNTRARMCLCSCATSRAAGRPVVAARPVPVPCVGAIHVHPKRAVGLVQRVVHRALREELLYSAALVVLDVGGSPWAPEHVGLVYWSVRKQFCPF